ncbi:MAG: adenosylcobinamide kinase [Oscillospiraceae bacterium]|nr:adenosylcobinamide kinase [Oscillospiraceae bacterium]
MKLIIGGLGQGKLNYVLSASGLTEADTARTLTDKPIIYGLHAIIRDLLDQGRDPSEVLTFAASHPSVIFICDEVGSGVVPVRPEERAWREAVGRVCCELAKEADTVVRVFCGLPMVLKGRTEWN